MVNSTMEIDRDGHDHSSNSKDIVFVLSAFLVVIEILGLLCNGIILTVYYKYSRLRTATNLFILNLAACNLLLASLQLMLSTPSYFSKEWLYEYNGCIAYGFAHQYLISVSVATLAVIAFDRFCVITKPVRKLQTFIVTKPRARILIFIIHVYSFVFTFPLLVGWNELTPDKIYKTGCYVDYSNRGASPMAYTILSTLFTCILPLFLTAFCYARIYKSVRNSSRRSTLHKNKRQSVYKEGVVLRRKSLYHTRTARMITIVMFFFLLTWLPTKVTGLLATFGCYVPPVAVYVSMFLAKACVMYNAVVYVFLNHRFRAAFLHLTFICREDGRLRFTTSAMNASARFGDILPSVIENSDRSRVLSGKSLSKLNFVPAAAEIPEISSIEKDSTVDIIKTSQDALANREESSIPGHDVLEIQPEGSLQSCQNSKSRLCENLEPCDIGTVDFMTVWSTNVSRKNSRGIQDNSVEIGDICIHEGIVAQSSNQHKTNSGSSCTSQDTLSSASHTLPKVNYGFNNPGLCQDDEYIGIENSDKNIEKYLELDINSLSTGNMA